MVETPTQPATPARPGPAEPSRSRSHVRRFWAAAAVTLLSTGCAPDDALREEAEPSRGRLVIVGGALQRENADVYRAVLEARDGSGPFCVLPTASGVPEESMASAVAAFEEHGADSVDGVFVSTDNPEAAYDDAVVQRLGACSGYWFVGGVQSRVVEVFRPGGASTPAYEVVMRRFAEGAVVSGSSAGAAIMSTRMIAGGSSAGALAHGTVEGGADDDEEGVVIEPGLGFDDHAVYDQHFLARGRIGRLLVATLAGVGGGVGFGIDENTALVLDGPHARVVGASGVVLVDARAAVPSATGFGGTGLRVTLLGTGDGLDLETLEVTPGAGKTALGATAGRPEDPEDPFARWAFLHLLHGLATSEVADVAVPVEGYDLRLRKGPGFLALGYGEPGVEGTPRGLTVGPLDVALVGRD